MFLVDIHQECGLLRRFFACDYRNLPRRVGSAQNLCANQKNPHLRNAGKGLSNIQTTHNALKLNTLYGLLVWCKLYFVKTNTKDECARWKGVNRGLWLF